MGRHFVIFAILFVFVLGLGLRGLQGVGALGTDFTYQGELKDGGVVVDGEYDFAFKVFDDAVAGAQKGGMVNEEDVGKTSTSEPRNRINVTLTNGPF